MSNSDRKVRVFISSTFRDMHAERDHLVTVVFPELRERCERLGLEFFDVDLRWGVPEKGVDGESANSWEYCRKWINEAKPFFICLLGQRYGWEPEPHQLRDETDQQAQAADRRSITDMEVHHALENDAHSRRCYFYLRQAQAPATATEFVDSPPLLLKLDALKARVETCGRPVWHYPCRWTGSGFADMEAFGKKVLEDLWSGILRDPRYVSEEVWQQVLGTDPAKEPRYTDESQPVPDDLAEKLIPLAKPPPRDSLEAERDEMQCFADSRLRWFQGREQELKELLQFIANPAEAHDSPHLAVLAAQPGQGKSALMAKLSESLHHSAFDIAHSPFVVTHFVGATSQSSSSYHLVKRLIDELEASGIPFPEPPQPEGQPREDLKLDFKSLCLRLSERLGDYDGERDIVLLLDAVNQLDDGHELGWLPYRLGPNVRVVVSCIDDAAAQEDSREKKVLAALDSRHPKPKRIPLGPLTADDVHTIVTSYLKEYCKELDAPHVDAICALPQARNPLYLLVMLAELRTLGGNDMNQHVPALIANMGTQHTDTVSLFHWVLERLEQAEGFGEQAVRWWCLYVALGRAGMSSRELSDLLVRKLGPGSAATAQRIERALRRYMQRRGDQWDFFHGQLHQAVVERCTRGGKWPTQSSGRNQEVADTIRQAHHDIADYFHVLADPEQKRIWRHNARWLGELPFHLACAGQSDELRELFSQLAFLAARVATGQVYEQVADYSLDSCSLTGEHASWHGFLKKHSQRLAQHPEMLIALVNHEGFPEAQVQVSGISWCRPWIRTSPEQLPAGEVKGGNGMCVQVTGKLEFTWSRVSAVAEQAAISFFLERLGLLRVIDLVAMRETEQTLSIRQNRPLVMACTPDATELAIFFESGEADLYRCIFQQGSLPERLELVMGFEFYLPESDDPVIAWHSGDLWYQKSESSLASVSTTTPHAQVESFPDAQKGELSALVFIGSSRLIALRQGPDTILLPTGSPPHLVQSAQLVSVCACGGSEVAAVFSDGMLVVFDLFDGLKAKAEVRVGAIRGALGWDGSRLLWMGADSGFNVWNPAKPAPLSVDENHEVLHRQRLHISPREWVALPDGGILLGTTHGFASFRIEPGQGSSGRGLEEIFGGETWRAVKKRRQDWRLLEKDRSEELLLARGVMGRIYCAPDGNGHFFAANGSGSDLKIDLSSGSSTPLRECPLGITSATGDQGGGCWFTDMAGDIYFTDSEGLCRCVAKISLPDAHRPHLENCDEFLVWIGHSSQHFPDLGAEMAKTFVFFKKTDCGQIERMSAQMLPQRDGFCAAVNYDGNSKRLVMLHERAGKGGSKHHIRLGSVDGFIHWQFQEIEVNGLSDLPVAHSALSANGKLLGLINMGGELCCLSVERGCVVATLSGSAPFTAVASGGSGTEFWLIEAGERVLKCELEEVNRCL